MENTSLNNNYKPVLYWMAEVLLILLSVYSHVLFPFYSIYFDGTSVGFAENQDALLLLYLAIAYMPYSLYKHVLLYRINEKSRIQLFIEAFKKKEFTKSFYQIVVLFAVKFLFIPLMYLALIAYGVVLWFFVLNFDLQQFSQLPFIEFFNSVVFTFVVYFAMFIALLVYLFGYLLESKKYHSTIVSVETNWFALVVTLICYSPFFPFLMFIIPQASQDFAFFKSQEITFVVRLFIILVLVLKTIAIFNLGLKSSNLTYRGLVTTGLYKWVRHPHYACKLIVWWIGIIPSAYVYPWLIGPMIFWTVIYYLRAITEEQHLLRNDAAYGKYQQKVTYLFLPKVF